MTIDEFASMTKRIIEQEGFKDYLPTLCFPGRQHIMVLEGISDDKQSDVRRIAFEWALDKAQGDEEFLLAYKEDADHFRIIRRCAGHFADKLFQVG
jgi:hypothetical protein